MQELVRKIGEWRKANFDLRFVYLRVECAPV